MYAIEVVYQNQRSYSNYSDVCTYKVDDSIKLAKGDRVVVPVLENYVFKVATVVNIIKEPKLKDNINYRWTVQKIDLVTYNKCLASSNMPSISPRL